MCVNVRHSTLFFEFFSNINSESQNKQKTCPSLDFGLAELFPVMRTQALSTQAPNMIL